jgi:hypothetical protein
VLARYRLLLLIGIRYELQIDPLRHIRIPLARDLRVADYAKEQNRYSRGQTPSRARAALSCQKIGLLEMRHGVAFGVLLAFAFIYR